MTIRKYPPYYISPDIFAIVAEHAAKTCNPRLRYQITYILCQCVTNPFLS